MRRIDRLFFAIVSVLEHANGGAAGRTPGAPTKEVECRREKQKLTSQIQVVNLNSRVPAFNNSEIFLVQDSKNIYSFGVSFDDCA